MKKQITIIQENASPIIIEDSDDRSIDEYANEMCKLLQSNNVSILHASSCSVISRPNKITSIIVRESPSVSLDISQEKQQAKKNSNKKNSIDGMISD